MYSIVDFQQHHQFEKLRQQLRATGDSRRLDRPLHFWALANDRRLPRALLGRATRDIVHTPFDEICATPGIGRKKIATLLRLLERALSERGEEDSFTHGAGGRPIGEAASNGKHRPLAASADGGFDPAAVSEPTWERWREAVKSHGFEREVLGRFAVSLQELPRVSWHTPLSDYTDLTLEQLRRRRTHGVKRVGAVIDVFRAVQSLLGEQPPGHLAVRVVPSFVAPLEAWLAESAQREDFASFAEVRRRFAHPLLEQLRLDAGPMVTELVAGRLRLSKHATSVRATAQRLGLTRARVYQLLAEPAEIMDVRWPEGKDQVEALAVKACPLRSTHRGANLFLATATLFFSE